MSKTRQRLYRRKLDNLLCRALDEDFCCMMWAIRAIQSGRSEDAQGFFAFPKEAVTTDLTSQLAIHPWKLETALNELLSVAKLKEVQGGLNRTMNCWQFASAARVNNVLTALENAEDGLVLRRVDVRQEMHRLLQRQIEWQRPAFAFVPFYRSAYLFGGERTRAFFAKNRGLEIDEFTLACFLMRVIFDKKPILKRGPSPGVFGLADDSFWRAVDLISIGIAEARQSAAKLRSDRNHISYKRSIFRMFPCLVFGSNRERICAPLPELVTLRGTTGLFYDTVSDDGRIRNEISARFEMYSGQMLGELLETHEVGHEFKYRIGAKEFASTDIVVTKDNEVSLLIECKATRMAHDARFSEQPFAEAQDGYKQMAKGAYQVWRFASHLRRKLVLNNLLIRDLRGIVLTLDTWLTWGNVIQEDVLGLARRMVMDRDSNITDEDQIPLIFCSIEDFERTLLSSNEDEFIAAVRASTTSEFKGWMLSSVHGQLVPDDRQKRSYPFRERMSEVLPWWDKIREMDNR